MTEAAGSAGKRAEEAAQRPGGRPDGMVTRWLHLTVLSSLAVAQPLLDLLGRYPEFLVAHGFQRGGVLLLVAVLLVLPPLPFIVVEILLLKSPQKLQETVHLLFVGFFAALLALLMLKRFGQTPAPVILGCAVVLAAATTLAYRRIGGARAFVTIMAVGLVVIPGGYLFKARSAGLLSPRRAAAQHSKVVECSEPIVFVVFDEFSTPVLLDGSGSINRVRYPNIAALADTATWYPQAVTVAEFTMVAVPGILTGVQPRRGQLPTFEAHPDNLFSLFGASYDLWALETMTSLCPEELNRRGDESVEFSHLVISTASDLWVVLLHLILPDPVLHRLPPISNTWGDFGDRASMSSPALEGADDNKPVSLAKMGAQEVRSDRRRRVGEFISALDDCDDRKLFFLHVMLPHGPWDLLPDGRRYPAERGVIWGVQAKENRWLDDEFLPLQAYQRYILQTMYVDRFVGELRRKLEDEGVFDRSLIVLVADHGVSFEPGQRRRNASLTNAHEILPVPLLIKGPRQRQGEVVEQLVSVLDVMPTIVRVLGLEAPWPMDGFAQTAEDPPRDRPIDFILAGDGVHEVHDRYLDGVSAVVERKLEVFGDGTDPLDIYRVGGHPELVGRTLAELDLGESLPWSVRIDDVEFYREVDPSSPNLPVFVQGVVNHPHQPQERPHLAVVANSKVGAVVPTHPDAERPGRFTALIPPWFLVPGENLIDVYVVKGHVGSETLHALVKR